MTTRTVRVGQGISQFDDGEMDVTEIKFKSTIDVKLIQSMGGDHMVVAAAKVSTNGEACLEFVPHLKRVTLSRQQLEDAGCVFDSPSKIAIQTTMAEEKTDEQIENENFGLINYLMKHRHGTPFEHSATTFYVHAPIFVWREWHRHRIGFSYNEESGRYKQLEPVFYLPDRERPMMKVDSWKPGRPKFTRCEDDQVFQVLCHNLSASYEFSYQQYQNNLALGIDPGLARDCLPVGIYSGCWVTCNPRSLMAFISLRTHEPEKAKQVSYPLWEIELAARTCEKLLSENWPLTYKAFCENGRVAP